jgi:hypothetical protein
MIFAKGMVAKGNIDLAGNGISSDSFDSSSTNYSTNGKYDPAKKKAGGDIATNSSVVDSLDVWNAEVYGKVSTGPGGNVKIQKGSVGSLAWVDSGKTGIQPGWSTDDMNVYFPDVDVPTGYTTLYSMPGAWGPGVKSMPWTINGTNQYFDYLIAGNYNYDCKFSLILNNKTMCIAGNVILIIRGDNFTISGSGGITIAPGGSLQIYMDGRYTDIGGNGIMNMAGNAMNFAYWGSPKNEQVKFSGNGEFIGTIYAPQADLVFNGGGASSIDFIGAAIGKSVKMGGHFKFHYDENLGEFGYVRGYTVVSWNEVAFGEL